MSHFIVGFICMSTGTLLGWWLRKVLTQPPSQGQSWETTDSGFVARWG